MSVAEAEAEATLAKPRVISTRFLYSELLLIFGRRRNWAGMAVLATIPIIISIAVKVSPPAGAGDGPSFLSSITSNGLFVAFAALTIEIPLFLPLAVATIAGDSLAGEANQGTLRYLLSVPVHRTRMLIVKYTAVVIFAFTATLWVAVVGVVFGLSLFGGGNMTLLSGRQIGMGDALLRLLGVCVYLALCLSAVGAVGVFVSSLTEQPIGATIAIMILTVGSFILDSIDQLSWLHPFLLTHSWMNYGDLLRDPVAWDGLTPGIWRALAYIAVFTTAAWARFSTRDVTS